MSTLNPEADRPIFVGGVLKSGTSLLRAMLGQHSQIISGLETYWFELDFVHQTGRNGGALAEDLARLAAYFELPLQEVLEIAGSCHSGEEFLDQFMQSCCVLRQKPRWLEKTPGNIMHMDRIFQAWPDARLIHIIRDPRDVFISLMEGSRWNTVELFVSLWTQYMKAAEAHKASPSHPASSYLEIRYEDLVSRPEATLREVSNFIGVTWESRVAVFEGNSQDYTKVLNQTGLKSSTLERLGKPLSGERMGLWTDRLSDSDFKAIHEGIARAGLGPLFDRLIDGPVGAKSP